MDISTRLPPGPDRPPGERRPRRARGTRLWPALIAVVFHAGLLALIVAGPLGRRPPTPGPGREQSSLVQVTVEPRPVPPPDRPDRSSGSPRKARAAAARPTPERPTPSPPQARPRLRVPREPPPQVERLDAGPAAADPGVVLGESDLAGATVAGTGGTGGAGGGPGSGDGRCDMVRRLQDALRADPDVTAAVTRSHLSLGPGSRAILVWNGEWLRSPGETGRGLAGVRQAIAMEVAFAPAACREQLMRGLVVISFSDRPDAPRLALGSREWRWTDLLAARR